MVYMSPQNLQTNKPSNLIRRKSPCSLLWKSRRLKTGTVLPGGYGEGPWASQGDATTPRHQSKDSVEDTKGAGQQGEDPSTQNNSFAGKLRGNTATRKMEAALWLLVYSLGRQACTESKRPGSIAAGVCGEKEVGLIMEK